MITSRKVFPILLIFGAASAGSLLNCTVCDSPISWNDCQKRAKVVTCTVDYVNRLHAHAVENNPNLVQGDAQDEFQCLAFHAIPKNPTAVEGIEFARDCTFKKVDFCNGWVDRMEMKMCATNPSGDVHIGFIERLGAVGEMVATRFFALYSRMLLGIGLPLKM